MDQSFQGTDFSWLAVDAADRLGWFTLNGFGPVPALLGDDADFLARQEDALGDWIRAAGRPFAFGDGDSMWLDAAAVGVFAFDFDRATQQYRIRAEPRPAVIRSDLPPRVQGVLTLRLPDADFGRGVVSTDQVQAAMPL